MEGGLSEAELRDRLIEFCDQLEQIEAALQLSPGDEDLLKARSDLTEIFQLTNDLLTSIKNQYRDDNDGEIKPPSPISDMFAEGDHDEWVAETKESDTLTSVPHKKMKLMQAKQAAEEEEAARKRQELRDEQERRIEAGERKLVRAIYSEDGRWYDAELVTETMTKDGTYLVNFIEYGNTEEVKAEDIMIKGVTMKHYERVNLEHRAEEDDTIGRNIVQGLNLGFVEDHSGFGEWGEPSKMAFKLMASMGYVQGKGLGKNGEGIVVPLGIGLRAPPQNKQFLGLGHEERELFEKGMEKERKRRKRKRKKKNAGGGANGTGAGRTPPVDPHERMFSFINNNLNAGVRKKGEGGGGGPTQEEKKRKGEKESALKKMKKEDLEENLKKTRAAREKLDLKLEQLKVAHRRNAGDPALQLKIRERINGVQQQLNGVKGSDKELSHRLKIKEETQKMTIF